MFGFKNKKNAKRREKRETLQVKMRASEVRARRARMLGTVFFFSLSLFLLVMAGWKGVEYVMREAVYTNPRLAIDQIEIETDGALAREKIREWARVKIGDNLLALDLNRVKRDLELRPIIASASAEKMLPRRLRITVVERKPIAVVYLLQAGGTGFDRAHLDAEGMVIPPLRAEERDASAAPERRSLPALLGFNASELRAGVCVGAPKLRAALELIEAHGHSPAASKIEFRSVDLTAPHTLVVTTSERSEVTFALGSFARQLARLESALDYGRRQGLTLATLDLAVGNYVPARWRAPLTNAPPAARFNNPLTSKPLRKHV